MSTLRKYWIQLALAFVTLALYAPLRHHDFINCDDPDYVTENATVQKGLTGAGIKWAFTTVHSSNWHPLTWISHMVDCQIFGLIPAGHHATNLLFHIANTLLLFELLRRMTGATWRSAFVAALFAWHPMHVESVAWVAERKDVLSTSFWFLTMLVYVRYAQEFKVQGSKFKVYYWLALLCFALGLLAKPMLVTLPFVLLLMDYWPLRRIYDLRPRQKTVRGTFTSYEPSPALEASSEPNALAMAETAGRREGIGRLILEKVPFFILAAGSSAVTYLAQQAGGAMSNLDAVSFGYRVCNALAAYLGYVEKLLWPHNLAFFYPRPHTWPMGVVIGGGILLPAVTIAVALWGKRRPYLAVGWFWFVGTLVPVIGLVQVGAASIADRYTYVPGIGLFIIVAWGMSDLVAGMPRRQLTLQMVGGATLAACLLIASVQLKYWHDDFTLYEHAIAVTDNNVLAYLNEANDLLLAHRTEDAIYRLKQVLALKPELPNANLGMALALDGQRKTKEAIPYYRTALRKKPDLPEVLNNMAWILAANPDPSLRKGTEAVEYAERACRVTHYERPMLIGTLAAAYAEAGRFKEAVDAGTKARDLAAAKGMNDLAQRNEALLKLYRANRPFHGAPEPAKVEGESREAANEQAPKDQ